MLGIPAEMIEDTVTALETQKQQNAEAFGVWPENGPALDRFLACATQWRAAAATLSGIVWIGLDYAGCGVALDRLGLAMTPAAWSDLQQMEAAALQVMNGGSPDDAGDAA